MLLLNETKIVKYGHKVIQKMIFSNHSTDTYAVSEYQKLLNEYQRVVNRLSFIESKMNGREI